MVGGLVACVEGVCELAERSGDAGKATAYDACDADLYLESDPQQAYEIAQLTTKRVICPASSEVFN